MIQFTSHDDHPPKKSHGHGNRGGHGSHGHSLEDNLGGEAVGEHALRIAMEQHRKEHEKRGEDVDIKVHSKKGLTEEQESIIEEIKKADKHGKEASYKAITADAVNNTYGASSGDGSYGHSHTGAEAACSCGNWTMTSSQATHEFMTKGLDDKKKGNKMYATDSEESGGGLYNQNQGGQDLEASMHSYSAPTSQYN